MNRTLDVKKVDWALQRAAQKAIHGTREERSGRFIPSEQPWDFLGATAEANLALSIRFLFPSVALFVILVAFFSKYHLSNAFLVAFSILVGPLFYLVYYKVIHKHMLRPAMDLVWGLPTHEAAKKVLKENNIDADTIAVPLLQDVIAKFLHAYGLRRNQIVTKSSVFHMIYMALVLFGGFGIYANFDRSDGLSFSDWFPLLLSIGLLLGAMGLDRKFGEKEESEIILQNSALFVGYVKDALKV